MYVLLSVCNATMQTMEENMSSSMMNKERILTLNAANMHKATKPYMY